MTREKFSTRIGILLALAGSAIGLGNLWKFPYEVGSNGGGTFILFYILIMIFLCIPVMIAEIVVGRYTHKNIIHSFIEISGKRSWGFIGVIGFSAAFTIMAFYSVVGGWTIEYLWNSIIGTFNGFDVPQLEQYFNEFHKNAERPVIMTFFFMAISTLIVMLGIVKGIERMSKIFMPLLLFFIIILACESLFSSGDNDGLEFLFTFNPDYFNSKTLLEALGQAFFSLSLGMGVLVTYGSYMKKRENIVKMAFSVAALDLFFALMAAIAIIPTLFSFGISPEEGKGMAFIVFPSVLQKIGGSQFLMIIFFSVFLLAAITSSISILEVVVSFITDKFAINRKKATVIIVLIAFMLSIVCSLSFGKFSNLTLFGENIFGIFDYIASNILLPLGGICTSLFVGWRFNKEVVKQELSNDNSIKLYGFKLLLFALRYIAPIGITIILLQSIGLF